MSKRKNISTLAPALWMPQDEIQTREFAEVEVGSPELWYKSPSPTADSWVWTSALTGTRRGRLELPASLWRLPRMVYTASTFEYLALGATAFWYKVHHPDLSWRAVAELTSPLDHILAGPTVREHAEKYVAKMWLGDERVYKLLLKRR